MKIKYAVFLLIAIFFVSFVVQAKKTYIPRTGVSLRLVPGDDIEDDLGVDAKVIEIKNYKNQTRLRWVSLVKEFKGTNPYPLYKVRSSNGIIDAKTSEGQSVFFHPHIWGSGYVRLTDSLPLWLAPEYLKIKSKRTLPFKVGFLNVSRMALQAAPDKIFEKLNYFQNLYDHYIENKKTSKLKLGKRAKKELEDFESEFFRVGTLAKSKAKIWINRNLRTVPVKVIGNDYYQMVVLDDEENPLILSFKVTEDKEPRYFKEVMKFLKKNMEFKITQVNY